MKNSLQLQLHSYFTAYFQQFGADGFSASGKPYIKVINDDIQNFPPNTFDGTNFVTLDLDGKGNVKTVRRVSSISPVE